MGNVFTSSPFKNTYESMAGQKNAADIRQFGEAPQIQGLKNLYQLLLQQGRLDPRLLAQAQAQNSRSTQQQQDAARGNAARSGLGNSGLEAALNAAIGSAGANRSANLNYQDIADSYGRNQQNLGLLSQLVTQPSLGYASIGNELGLGLQSNSNKAKAATLGFAGGLLGAAGKAFGMG